MYFFVVFNRSVCALFRQPAIIHLKTLCLHFNDHFSRWTWVSRYQNVSFLDLLELRVMEMDGDNWSYKTCKAAVKSAPPANQRPAFYRPDALLVTKPTVADHCRDLSEN